MKKTNDCFSLMNKIKTNNFKKTQSIKNNLSTKLSKSNIYYNKKPNQKYHYSYNKTNFTLVSEKSKNKKFSNPRCHTEYSKSKSKINNNQKQNQILINSYEKSLISLFDSLKTTLKKSQYEKLKIKFQHSFENNLKSNFNETKSSSFIINNSNSIKKIIEDSIKKCQSNNNSYSNNKNNYTKNSNVVLNITPSLNIKKNHNSLYSLNRYGRTIITQSPNKFNQNSNNSIIKKYYNVANNNKNSKSTQNGSSYLSGNKNSNSKQNISKELSFPKNNNIKYNNNNIIQKNLNNKVLEDKISEDINCNLNQDMNNVNKTADDSNVNYELLNKIKNSLDDSLKGIFAFSYEDFLNKSSDRLEAKNN